MRIRTIRYIGSSLALLAASAFFFSSFVAPGAKAAPGEGSKVGKTAAPTALFTNPTPIVINERDTATPYPSDINVTGLIGPVLSVKVTLNGFSHTFPDDVGIVLKGPTGAALLIQDGAGDDPDMNNVTYTIADSGATILPNMTAWGPGTYKPTTYFINDVFPAPGPITAYGSPGPTGGGTATFASTFNGTNPNGTWSLFIVDFAAQDSGEIAGGWTLEVTATIGDPLDSVVDFNGDGKTDWAVVRGIVGGQMMWFIQENSVAGPITYQQFGTMASDIPVPEDFDGDNKSDIAIWRDPQGPGNAAFYILQSGSSTVRGEFFGLTGDDPSVAGDYDGNGSADLAVVRRTAGQMFWYYRLTPGGPIFTRQWGSAIDFVAPGDYDGDGKNDFVVQRPGSITTFWANFGAAAPGVLSRLTYFGLNNDLVVPGDYDGDGKTDLAVAREVSGSYQWYYEPSTALGTFLGGQWGTSAIDYLAQGDYDGDGKTDFAVWRTNGDPTQNFFLVRKSSDGTLLFNEWGIDTDYPVAAYNTH